MKTVAIHPNDDFVVTGNSKGQLHFWYCLTSATHKRKGKCTTKEIHWHAHQVNALAFTGDTAYVLSGGEEVIKAIVIVMIVTPLLRQYW
jgi:NET1-associated nuclear protein 1 (U3 small nucleolar RNA-associated protein 17)